MARNSEKAMTALARWRKLQMDVHKDIGRRPYLASECDSLYKAQRWRREIISEISKKVAQIQNAGLGEFKLRDLNDEINKLLREKRHWENRIKELGGPNLKRYGPRMLDNEGKEAPGARGYKYFGAAKDLPGVRELFEPEAPKPLRKTRGELMKDIDADYYGYRDDDDGVLLPREREVEAEARARKVAEWTRHKEAVIRGEEEPKKELIEANIYTRETEVVPKVTQEAVEVVERMETDDGFGNKRFVAHVPVPSQKEVEDALIRRKKMELLQKYTSESLQEQTEASKQMLGLD